MLVLEGLGQEEEIISEDTEEEAQSILFKRKMGKKGQKRFKFFKPRETGIYDPACKKRCMDALKECLTGCRI